MHSTPFIGRRNFLNFYHFIFSVSIQCWLSIASETHHPLRFKEPGQPLDVKHCAFSAPNYAFDAFHRTTEFFEFLPLHFFGFYTVLALYCLRNTPSASFQGTRATTGRKALCI